MRGLRHLARFGFGFLWIGVALPAAGIRIEQDIDYSLYDNILQSYVSADGLVDYAGLRASSQKDLQDVLAQFARADLSKLDYRERLSFWLNAYNANLLQQILNHPDMERINQHVEMFDTALPIANGSYSLNDIEHRIIRGKTNPKTGEGPIPGVTLDIFDPRIHFALNPGTLGGPALQSFSYTSKTLEHALRKNSSDFANSPKHVRIENDRLMISQLMNQYAEDFNGWGGPASYLARTVDPSLRPDSAELKRRLTTDYRKAEFDYDWTVNDIQHADTKRPKLMRSAK